MTCRTAFFRTTFFFCILLFTMLFFTPSNAASAAPFLDTPINLTALQKTCQIINIHLTSYSHTVSCSKTLTRNTWGKRPDIQRDNSCNSYSQINLYNYNWTQLVCFYGSGYLAVSIQQVNEVDNVGFPPAPEWFRAYPGGKGEFVNLDNPGDDWGFGQTGALVTQICIGSSQAGHC